MSPKSIPFKISNEFDTLTHVIAGRGEGFHRDPSQVAIVNATQAASGHPSPERVLSDLAGFHSTLRTAGINVHVPDLAPESVQDQTCPRDIGFVIGGTFVAANMTDSSRTEEIKGLRSTLVQFNGPMTHVPGNIRLEGGDVIIDGNTIFVGHGNRSDAQGTEFLAAHFPDYDVIALPCVHGTEKVDILHLDCAFNPLGLGHALIYPEGLAHHPDALRRYDWIEVTDEEAYALATNILSIAPDHIIARDHPDCARVNTVLRRAGYNVTEVTFDAVPSIGGSFRCATLPLRRV